jgi:hypothetical protein
MATFGELLTRSIGSPSGSGRVLGGLSSRPKPPQAIYTTERGRKFRYPLADVDYSGITKDSGPAVSYGDLIESAYSNAPGGKDKAISLSLDAQEQFWDWMDLGGEQAYGGFKPLDVHAPRPVRLIDESLLNPLEGMPNGMFSRRDKRPDGALQISEKLVNSDELVKRDATLKHEAVHALLNDRDPVHQPQNWSIASGRIPVPDSAYAAISRYPLLTRLLPASLSGAKKYGNYLAQFAEIDARLPEIRQLYAYNTGRHVKNKSDARSAWEWYRRHGAWGENMDFGDFLFYDRLEAPEKEFLLRRMTAIPSVLAGLTAAGAAAGTDQQRQ